MKEFNEVFGRTTTEYAEREKFVNRAHSALQALRERVADYDQLFRAVCFELGKRPSDYNYANGRGVFQLADIGTVAGKDFFDTLEVLVAVMRVLRLRPAEFEFMDQICRSLPERATTDLGIVYEDGQFYPKGEPELDKDLINGALTVLKDYPAENKDLRAALDSYRAGKKTGVIEPCYCCIEGFTRQILRNGKTLNNNKADLLRLLNMSEAWGKILSAYIDFTNDHGRHAGPNRHNVSDAEIEAYLYQTCLMVRLIVKIK